MRSEIHLLVERREALEQELKSRSAAALQNADQVAQERAESNALRSALTYQTQKCCGVSALFLEEHHNSCCYHNVKAKALIDFLPRLRP